MTRFIVIALLAVVAGECSAGKQNEMTCSHCGLKGTYGVGGGFTFEELTAFCSRKDHFVSVRWKRGDPSPKPAREEGAMRIYECPICQTATARVWDEKKCPRCGSKDITIRDGLMFYD